MNQIILSVTDLKQALPGFSKVINRKSSLPVLQAIKVSRDQQGQVSLSGTDLDTFVTYNVEQTQSGSPMEVLVPFEQLNKTVKGSKQDLALIIDGKITKLRYSIGGSPVEQPVNAPPIKEWPAFPVITTPSNPLEPGFGLALKQAMASCSEDSTRHILQGACLDTSDKSAHYIVGTNGRMLFAANSFTFPLKESVIIRDSKFITGSDLLDSEPCFLAVQPGKTPKDAKHILLHNQRWQFISREIEGQYPNWKQVIPEVDAKWTKVQLPPSAIEQLLEVIPKLPGADRKDKDIRLCIEKELSVEGRSKDDEFATTIPIPDAIIQGQFKYLSINREFLLNALKFGLNEWAVDDELTPLIATKGGKRMVIMPVRLAGPAQNTATPAATTPQPTTPTPASNPVQERKTDMPKTTAKPETKPSETSPTLNLIDQVENIKESLKTVIRDLSAVVDAVKQAEKDKRASEKEVEAARATLKKLQQVSL